MNTSIRKVAVALTVVFLALFINLQVVQVSRSHAYSTDPRNPRLLASELNVKRGEILAADGTVLAESQATGDKSYPWRRVYPEKNLFGHITGYYTNSAFCGSAGLESSYDAFLAGREPATSQNFVDQLLGRKNPGNTLQITIEPKLQQIAAQALGDQRGAVAAIDTDTGAVLALYSSTTYDPNLITKPLGEGCATPKKALEKAKGNPLLFRATQERYPPGSTFKIVTATAGLENGMTRFSSFPNPRVLVLPQTNQVLRNFTGGVCPRGNPINMLNAFEVSCDTTFAQVALRIGIDKFASVAERYGIDESLNFDIAAAKSCMDAVPGGACNVPPQVPRPQTAYSGIGQFNVRMTALQMAVVTATIENNGRVPHPYLVQKILDPNNGLIRNTHPSLSGSIYSSATADALRAMMIGVVKNGTGTVVGFPRNVVIGGKTGTAEVGIKGEPPDVWFVAWAPHIAVAAIVENGGRLGRNATGGKVAGPITKALIV
ncbi:MAG TPA: penicillin-binding transpeptidase domain-containing protein, partial [Actinomycetota bacterium]|nr:penicillin-binding transpeptidase domain-containing protein [Actinomycetota bacterium]